MIRAVIFDVDGVLLDSFEGNLKFFGDLLEHVGYPAPTREEYAVMMHLSMWDVIRERTGLTDDGKIREICDIGKRREIPYPLDLLRVPDDIRSAIGTLDERYLLGVVTSRIRSSVYEAPKLAELEEYFKVTVSFEDTEEHKPSPAPLFLAAELLGVSPEESVYVGDTESDVIAARAAGMKVVLYSESDRFGADAFVSVLSDIPAAILEW
jgi:pyrophosphatase PpaX